MPLEYVPAYYETTTYAFYEAAVPIAIRGVLPTSPSDIVYLHPREDPSLSPRLDPAGLPEGRGRHTDLANQLGKHSRKTPTGCIPCKKRLTSDAKGTSKTKAVVRATNSTTARKPRTNILLDLGEQTRFDVALKKDVLKTIPGSATWEVEMCRLPADERDPQALVDASLRDLELNPLPEDAPRTVRIPSTKRRRCDVQFKPAKSGERKSARLSKFIVGTSLAWVF